MKNIFSKPQILVVDDEQVIRQLFRQVLEEKKYRVQTAKNGEEALRKVQEGFFNLLLIDLQMPGINGIEVLKEIKKNNPYIEVIVITGYPTIELAVEVIKIGAFDFICKPFDVSKIRLTVEECLQKQKTNASYIQLSELMILFEIDKVISASFDLDLLLNKIMDAALVMTKASKGLLFLPDKKTEKLSVKVVRGLDAKLINKAQESIDKELLGASLISASLHFQGNTSGVISVFGKNAGEKFTERDQTILSVLAVHAVTAIDNIILYQRLEEEVDILKQTINQLDQTQGQLIQTEKMASVGRLAFGIAHEIRNPLAIILQGIEFLKNKLPEKNKVVAGAIQKIKSSAQRANNVIVELLKFSKSSDLKLKPTYICELLDSTLDLVQEEAALKSIKLNRDFPQKDIPIKADYNILKQAFFNLLMNAIWAVPKKGEVCLEVSAEKKSKAGRDEIIIKVKDTGVGIEKDKLKKIFEPFFTTKEPGEGVGLGLSIVHLILKRHKALIEVESQLGKGTVFTIRLPKDKKDK